MKRAIAYLRKSTDIQEASLEQQKEKIIQFAKEHSIAVIEFFAEEACGENVEARPQFRRMIECCKSEVVFQYVLVYDISRWGRFENPKESVYWEVEIEKAGRKLVFISEGFKDDSIGTSITNFVKSAEASEYLKNVRRQTKRGMIYNAQQGFWMGGRPPYGYSRAIVENCRVVAILPEGKQKGIKGQKIKLVVNKPQAKIIKTIFVMNALQGLSTLSIVRYLNQNNYPPPRGKLWMKHSIWRMLHNEVYIGMLVYNRENKHKRQGDHKYNPKDQWVIVENAHEPIITRELWDIVQSKTRQAFTSRKFTVRGSRPASLYLLSGLIKCGECGFNFHGGRYHRKHVVYRIYRCGGYNMYGNETCSRWEANAERLEGFIISHIQRKIDNAAWRKGLKEELLKMVRIADDKSENRLQEIDTDIKEVSLKIENWKKAIDKGLDLENAIGIINEYVFQRERLYHEKNKILTKVNKSNTEKIVERMLSYLDDFNEIFKYGQPEQKKEFLRMFVKSVFMYPATRQAKIIFYLRPVSGIITENKACVFTEEIIYQN